MSIPDAILFVIITLSASGCKNLLDFKVKQNVFKLTISVLCLVCFSDTIRTILDDFNLIIIINSFIYYLGIVLVYRHKPLQMLYGYAISLIVSVVSELLAFAIFQGIFGYSLEYVYHRDYLRFLTSFIGKSFQVITILLILKCKKIVANSFRLSSGEKISIVTTILLINLACIAVNSMLAVNIKQNIVGMFSLFLCIMIFFFFFLLCRLLLLRKKILINEKKHKSEISHIQQLLSEGKVNHTIELIKLKQKTNQQE